VHSYSILINAFAFQTCGLGRYVYVFQSAPGVEEDDPVG
jgi:hypothetical protein